MPNWCHVRIHFAGLPADLNDLRKKIIVPPAEREPVDPLTKIGGSSHFADGAIDLTRVRPRPDDIGDDWYWWSVNNWGTKWAPDVNLVSSGVHEFEVAGDSAWGPPSELVRFISEQFHLWAVVTYDEPGMCFAGAEAYRDGEKVYDGHFDYDDVELPEVDWNADNCDEQYDDFAFAVLREIEIREDAAHAFLLEVTA
jgi:hypothetical protein